jgi:hypothetical protein
MQRHIDRIHGLGTPVKSKPQATEHLAVETTINDTKLSGFDSKQAPRETHIDKDDIDWMYAQFKRFRSRREKVNEIRTILHYSHRCLEA